MLVVVGFVASLILTKHQELGTFGTVHVYDPVEAEVDVIITFQLDPSSVE
jgi:hypothetical protein